MYTTISQKHLHGFSNMGINSQNFAGFAASASPDESNAPTSYFTAVGVERKIITDPRKIAKQGGKLRGSPMTVKQALTSKGQYFFTRSSEVPGAYRHPDFWSDLGPVPENFDEQKYLQLHPDVARAVARGVMPSGLWHYLKYGKKEGRTFSGFGMWRRPRRPGYLAGVFSNWHRND